MNGVAQHNTKQAEILEQHVNDCIQDLEDIQAVLLNTQNGPSHADYYLEKGKSELEKFWDKVAKSIKEASREEILISDDELAEIKNRVDDIQSANLNEYYNFIKNAKTILSQ
jgi:hypothetical protein